jgi:integrase
MEACAPDGEGVNVVAGSNPVTPTSPSPLPSKTSTKKSRKVTAPVTHSVTRREHRTRYPGVYAVSLEDDNISYFIRYRIHGKAKKVLAGRRKKGMTPELANSMRMELIIKSELAEVEDQPPVKNPTLSELFKFYLKEKAQELGRPLKTEGRITNDFNRHFYGLKTKRVSELQQSDLRAFRHRMVARGLSKKSLYNHLGLFRTLLRFGHEHGLCALPNWNWMIPKPKELPKTTERLNNQEVEEFLQTLSRETPQVQNLFLLALYTGMRKSELFRLQWRDINWKHRHIIIREAKSGDANEKVLITEMVEEVLRKQWEIRSKKHQFVFYTPKGKPWKERSRSLQLIMDRMRKSMQIPKDFRLMHGLRHQYGSVGAANGVPLATLMTLMRHSTPQMTMRYIELIAEEERNAAEKIGNVMDCYKKST